MLSIISFLCFAPVLASGSGCSFVQDDINSCPLANGCNDPSCGTWPTDPDQLRCVPRPAGYNKDGINRTSELVAHTYVPFVDPNTQELVPNVCPQYKDVCCSNVQMMALHTNFKGIWAAFGDISGGGCPGCYQNVVDFWCSYTCSPNNADFVKVLGLDSKTDPVGGGQYTVETLAVNISMDYACSVYGSCSGTGKVKEFSPLQNCEGFFNYQGETEAIYSGLSFITFSFVPTGGPNATSSPPLLDSRPFSCCNFPSSISPTAQGPGNGTNMSCPCANCPDMCAGGTCPGAGSEFAGLGVSPDDPLSGFDGGTVLWTFSAVVAASIATVMWRSWGAGEEDMPHSPSPMFRADAGSLNY